MVPIPEDLGSIVDRIRPIGLKGHGAVPTEMTEFGVPRTYGDPAVSWVASMVTPTEDVGDAPLLRHGFALPEGHGSLIRAKLHMSSLGVFEAFINGQPVSGDVLSPGWTSYQWRLRYRTYDVLALMQRDSVLGVALGNGWYRGRLGWDTNGGSTYGNRLGLIAQLELDFEDGHRKLVLSGSNWRSARSAVLANDLYDGESIDARLREDGWTVPGFDDTGWSTVDVLPFDRTTLEPYACAPVVRHEHLRPVGISTSPSGHTLVDFRQNLTGWTKIRVCGPAGSEISVSHAEVLENGELGIRPLRTAKATDRYVLSGKDDVFEPTLTFHGFRYAQVDGWPGELSADDIEAVVVHTDLRRIGTFECSNDLLNKLHHNVVWGFRGNSLDVPTDCPQRDERLGWTGDLAVFVPTAAYLYDVRDWLTDWLRDLSAEQRATGGLVPLVIPDPLTIQDLGMSAHGPYALWGDACIWVPWALWQAYGDRDVLEAQFDSMTAHLERVDERLSPDGVWNQGFQFGDWLDPDAPPEQPWMSKVRPGVVATACLYRSTRTVAEVARILGRPLDAKRYETRADRTRSAFRSHYLQENGTIKSDAPTAYALAIAFGLLEGEDLERAGNRLSELVAKNEFHVSTGFAGTPYILDALTSTGHLGDAYRMLLETSCPSWIYPVTMGATTIWERWDAMLPDGSINPGEMTSFNHYALGAVADWMHRTIGGLTPLAPGYTRVRVAPRPGGDLSWATARLESPSGEISAEWTLEAGKLTGKVSLPDAVTGLLDLPGQQPVELRAGDHAFGQPLT
jgi:alpha-L-rhamnosidase